ncbi:hypothetical protein Landi51_06026 [Colletotrichum acutatum]
MGPVGRRVTKRVVRSESAPELAIVLFANRKESRISLYQNSAIRNLDKHSGDHIMDYDIDEVGGQINPTRLKQILIEYPETIEALKVAIKNIETQQSEVEAKKETSKNDEKESIDAQLAELQKQKDQTQKDLDLVVQGLEDAKYALGEPEDEEEE